MEGLSQKTDSRVNYQRGTLFVCFLSTFFFFVVAEWQRLTDSNCAELPCKQTFFFLSVGVDFFFFSRRFFSFFLFLKLTGQAKLKGKIILDLSLLTELFKENVFPPRTAVDPIPKLQGPAADTLDWYSFRQTLKKVSHSSRVHFLSPVFRAPSQHAPLSSSPLTLCIDKIWNSNCPDPSDTCWGGGGERQNSECNECACVWSGLVCTRAQRGDARAKSTSRTRLNFVFFSYCCRRFCLPPPARRKAPRTLARRQSRRAASTGPRLKIMPPDCCGCHSSRTGGSAGDTRHQSSPPLASTCTGGERDFDPAGAQVPDS